MDGAEAYEPGDRVKKDFAEISTALLACFSDRIPLDIVGDGDGDDDGQQDDGEEENGENGERDEELQSRELGKQDQVSGVCIFAIYGIKHPEHRTDKCGPVRVI